MFSAECNAALLKAGYDPAWFGSYNHTAKQIRAAKDQCEKFDEAVKAGTKPGVPEPSPAQRYLASCQSGHLTQNAVYQTERGNPCSNVAPGHSDTEFPCMPQAGHAMQQGGEHQLATVHEQNSAAGPDGTRTAGQKYPASQIEADSDERTRKVANDQELAQRNSRQATSPAGGAEGASAGGSAQSGGSAADAAGADAGKPSKPNEPWNEALTGKTAGDCINSFRKAGEAAMREQCKDDREKNRKRANGPKAKNEQEGQAYRDKLAKDAADAQAESKKDPDNKDKQKRASRATARSTAAQRAKCRADQGDQLAAGASGPFDGVVPRNVAPPKTQTGQTGADAAF
jgi:hypothetical protein